MKARLSATRGSGTPCREDVHILGSTEDFLGQITASTGFTLYSILVRNWVFVVTNALMLLSAMVGGLVVLKHRRAERRSAGCGVESPSAHAAHA